MGIFGKKNKKSMVKYDPSTMIPVLRCSICTGEQVLGFRNKTTGEFVEVSLIRNATELQRYLDEYGIDKVEKEY